MILFRDRITGDELFTDAVCPKFKDCGECPDSMVVFLSKMVQRTAGGIDESLIGGNKSAEEQEEALEDGAAKSGFDFVVDNGLEEIDLNKKKDFQLFFKGCMKKLLADYTTNNESKVPELKKSAMAYMAHIVKLIDEKKDLSFFVGSSDNEDKVPCVMEWNEDGVSGTVYALRLALKEEKL